MKINIKNWSLVKRYILFIISLFISALGVAIMKKGNLGISPTSSIANVMSIKFTSISLGTWLIIWNCILILGQIILLRKDFKIIQLLQLPLSILFGYFTDLCIWIVSSFVVESYLSRIIMIVLGINVLAFSISLAVIANVILNSGEAFVKAISDVTKKEFGTVKSVVDVTYVVLAVILSLIFFNFNIVGVREGTIIIALTTGMFVKFYTKIIRNSIEKLLK